MTSPSPLDDPAGNRPPENSQIWHTLEGSAVVQALHTSPQDGLTADEARARLTAHGPNELAEAPRPSLLHNLIAQFNSFLVIVLIVAAVISAVLGDWIEAAVILAIVVLNAVLGLIQEHRAEQALDALRRLSAPEAHVIRGGHRQVVPAGELVPGDLVLLEAGNYVPADLRLIESVNLRIEEAALTGESVPVDKDAGVVLVQDINLGDRRNTAFMGTLVSYGRGRGVVVSTGMLTQIGLIATMLQSVQQEDTPLQRRLNQLGKALGWGTLVICGVVFLVGWLRGVPPLEMFIIAVSLAVAAVPEGLPAVVTVTLALGMREMIARHALIRRLSSVETLGSTTVICSDKTGTLTQNQMTVTRAWADGAMIEVGPASADGRAELQQAGRPVELQQMPALATALWVALLANDAVVEPGENDSSTPRLVGDPTEAALLLAAVRAGADPAAMGLAYPRIQEVPFDSSRKRMTTIHTVRDPRPEDPGPFYDSSRREHTLIAVKGAPDIVLGLCTRRQTLDDRVAPLEEADRQRVLQANESMTQDALRVLAVAYRVQDAPVSEVRAEAIERDLIFVGLFGMIDPPRAEVPAAIQLAQHAGLRSVMITGDFPATARAIAGQIGLIRPGHGVITGADLDGLDDAALAAAVMRNDVYARVSPEHKTRIVEGLKANGQVVAMTGDGVNDAPALKRADIGVGMGITGTDVVKETADMVLTDDNFASIVAAVEQGRIIYSNIRKFVFYLISCNLAEIAVIFIAVLAGLPSPLTAIQLLWLNLITDGAPALALGVERGDPDIMNQPPRPPTEPIINREMRLHVGIQTVAKAAATLTAYAVGLHLHPEQPEFAETMAFATLALSELLRAYTSRSERYSVFKIGVFSNRAMNVAVFLSLVLTIPLIYVPALQPLFDTVALGWSQWALILPLVALPAVVHELTKWAIRWRTAHAELPRDVAPAV